MERMFGEDLADAREILLGGSGSRAVATVSRVDGAALRASGTPLHTHERAAQDTPHEDD